MAAEVTNCCTTFRTRQTSRLQKNGRAKRTARGIWRRHTCRRHWDRWRNSVPSLGRCASTNVWGIERLARLAASALLARILHSRLGDAPRVAARGTANVHHERRARHHDRVVRAPLTGLDHHTIDPSVVGWARRGHFVNGRILADRLRRDNRLERTIPVAFDILGGRWRRQIPNSGCGSRTR